MSNLTRQQCLELDEEHFAVPEHKSCPIFDANDVVKALHRVPFAKDPEAMRFRIAELALRKNLPIPPTLAREQLILLAGLTVKEGLVSPLAQSDALRFTVKSHGDIDRACSIAKQRLAANQQEERNMSTNFKHLTPEGQMELQITHDRMARAGALCKKPKLSTDADFVSQSERTAFQKVHDLVVAEGARCDARGAGVFGDETAEEFGDGTKFGLSDPSELARAHAERRNARQPGAPLRTRDEVPESATKHIARRNEQIKAEREKTKRQREEEGLWWK